MAICVLVQFLGQYDHISRDEVHFLKNETKKTQKRRNPFFREFTED